MNPPRLRSICPIFQIANYARSLEFYTRVLGFELEWSAGEPPLHASFGRDGLEINVKVVAHPAHSHAYIEVDGVDAYYERIVKAGAPVVHALADRDYGMRDACIADPDGNFLGIGESLIKD